MIEKNLHSEDDGVTNEQSVDYSYNIRGWLTSLNDSQLADPDDLFGMELHYNSNPIDGANKHFNESISAMQWSDASGSGSSNYRSYNYSYDHLNRLTDADHRINGNNNNSYDVENLQYDLNGNIQTLDRRAEATSSYIDELSYSYVGNQLQKVDDSGDDSAGFIESGSGADYTYDENGNMISDANKGITDIDYNHLNLPTKVVFDAQNYIEYLYDAAGIKLQQKVYEDGSLIKTTDYVGEFIYENGVIALVQHEEGRIVSKDGDWDYQYHLKDHLGNVRMTFSTTPEDYTEIATYEDANTTQEVEFFGNLNPRISHPLGGKGARLNNATPNWRKRPLVLINMNS
ncbi:RHS repeat domain-containing protein [Ekhidna sp.]